MRRCVPGVGTPERPVTVPLKGITDGTQAAKEANRMAAAQFYHARVITWESVLRAVRGDVVALAHDLAGGSVGGRLISINDTRDEIEITAEIPLLGTIWIWDLNGDVFSYQYTRSGSTVSLTSGALPSAPLGIEDDPLSYQAMAFDLAADPLKVRITGIEHAAGGVFRYTARNEVAQYYAARVADLTHALLPPRESDIGQSRPKLSMLPGNWREGMGAASSSSSGAPLQTMPLQRRTPLKPRDRKTSSFPHSGQTAR